MCPVKPIKQGKDKTDHHVSCSFRTLKLFKLVNVEQWNMFCSLREQILIDRYTFHSFQFRVQKPRKYWQRMVIRHRASIFLIPSKLSVSDIFSEVSSHSRCSAACAIEEEHEVIITGGSANYVTTWQETVVKYTVTGKKENLPSLNKGRQQHACGHFKNSESSTVLCYKLCWVSRILLSSGKGSGKGIMGFYGIMGCSK